MSPCLFPFTILLYRLASHLALYRSRTGNLHILSLPDHSILRLHTACVRTMTVRNDYQDMRTLLNHQDWLHLTPLFSFFSFSSLFETTSHSPKTDLAAPH